MKTAVLVLSGILLLLGTVTRSYAALPDRDIYAAAMQKYSLLVDQGRDGCTYYANPSTLTPGQDQGQRSISVLLTRGENGGTLCNGVFKFEVLEVDCKTSMISYNEYIGSPATWDVQPHEDVGVADRICSLPL